MKNSISSAFLSVVLITLSADALAKSALGQLFGAAIGKAVGHAAGKGVLDSQSIESGLREMARQANAQMPMMIDKETRIDSISTGPGQRFTYNYTLINAPASAFDRTVFRQKFQSTIRPNVCASSDLQIFFRNNITIGYAYKGKDGTPIDSIDVTSASCATAPIRAAASSEANTQKSALAQSLKTTQDLLLGSWKCKSFTFEFDIDGTVETKYLSFDKYVRRWSIVESTPYPVVNISSLKQVNEEPWALGIRSLDARSLKLVAPGGELIECQRQKASTVKK